MTVVLLLLALVGLAGGGIGWAYATAPRQARRRLQKSPAAGALDLSADERNTTVAQTAGRVRAACVGAAVGAAVALCSIGVVATTGDRVLFAIAGAMGLGLVWVGAAVVDCALVVNHGRQARRTVRVAALAPRNLAAFASRSQLVVSGGMFVVSAGLIVLALVRDGGAGRSLAVTSAGLLLSLAVIAVLTGTAIRAASPASTPRERAVDDLVLADSVHRLVAYAALIVSALSGAASGTLHLDSIVDLLAAGSAIVVLLVAAVVDAHEPSRSERVPT